MKFLCILLLIALIQSNIEKYSTENRTLTLRTVKEIEQNYILNDKHTYTYFEDVGLI
jgi:hypothetical protein